MPHKLIYILRCSPAANPTYRNMQIGLIDYAQRVECITFTTEKISAIHRLNLHSSLSSISRTIATILFPTSTMT